MRKINDNVPFTVNLKKFKHSLYLSIDSCIRTMEYYSATNKDDIMSFARKWMQLRIILLSKINQSQKDKGDMFL